MEQEIFFIKKHSLLIYTVDKMKQYKLLSLTYNDINKCNDAEDTVSKIPRIE